MKIESQIKKLIKKSGNIFVVAHKNLDLDAIGACIAASAIANYFHKESYIIIDDEKHELGVAKILNEAKESHNIINSSEIPNFHKKDSVLIIVDTNKAQLLQNDKILHYFTNIINLDHHQETDQTISNTTHIINEDASSACEILTGLIEKYKVLITKQEATHILSGIILDTTNFIVKTDKDTYHAAYYLAKCGASPSRVQYYLKQDINEYIMRQKVITDVKVIKGKYAISVAPDKIQYKREELAKIADTLLQFNNIEASFVLGNRVDGGVGLSARSTGELNVGEVAEALGGGGDTQNAAAQIKNLKLNEAEKELIKVLR